MGDDGDGERGLHAPETPRSVGIVIVVVAFLFALLPIVAAGAVALYFYVFITECSC